MLTIELRHQSSDVCPYCENTGVVLPGTRKLVTDSGVFCSCPVGVEKWESTRQTMASIEEALDLLPQVPPPRPGGPFRDVRRSF